MRFDQAIASIDAALSAGFDFGRKASLSTPDGLLRALQGLGLIELSLTPTEDELRTEALRAVWHAAGGVRAGLGPAAIAQALDEHGFEIVRKP